MRRPSLALLLVLVSLPAAECLANCPGDTDFDGDVDANDFLELLSQWGPCPSPPDPCTADFDGNDVVDAVDFLALLAGWGACSEPKVPALVIYNQNYPDLDENGKSDALDIAEYYCDQRELSPASLCAVRLPTGDHATPEELLGARRTIIEDCMCGQWLAGSVPCDLDDPGAFDAILDAIPIAHLVYIKGIPARLYETDTWGNEQIRDKRGPSFGYTLSFSLANDVDLFTQLNFDASPYTAFDSRHGYVPALNPAADKIFAWGYLEAIDTPRTIDLIDRTLQAEATGLRGNIFVMDIESFFFELTSSASECYGPGTDWAAPTSCRVGTTAMVGAGAEDGVFPGTPGSHVPKPSNAAIHFGDRLPPESQEAHSAFGTYERMKRWYKSDSDTDCPAECQDEACRAASTDYFRNLDTACIGGAPGFIAYQSKSFVVQGYGFTPPGWKLVKLTAQLRSMPVVTNSPGPAYTDSNANPPITDDRYAHFGAYTYENPDVSICLDADGSPTIDCRSHLAVNLESALPDFDPPLDVEEPRVFELRFRYRYADPNGPGAQMRVGLVFHRVSPSQVFGNVPELFLTDTGGEWSTVSLPLGTPGQLTGHQIDRISVVMYSSDGTVDVNVPSNILVEPTVRGFLDLDAFEVFDTDGPDPTLNIFPLSKGSFVETLKDDTDHGGWPACVIDRMNGIASWGNGSHIGGGGGSGNFPGAFLAGRTLGEALAHAGGGHSTLSALAYGDPLYRPSAAKLFASAFVDVYQDDRIGEPDGYDVWLDTYDELVLAVNALHGTDNLETTSWTVERCSELGIEECAGSWDPVVQGTGAVFDYVLPSFESLLYQGTSIDQTLTLRLRVWNAGDDVNDLVNHAFFDYHAHVVPDCPDFNGDGVIDAEDAPFMDPYWCPSWYCSPGCPFEDGFCIADVDQDGDVDTDDAIFVGDRVGSFCQVPQGCPGDITGDAAVDDLDLAMVAAWVSRCAKDPNCVCPSVGGYCLADFNQDGTVDGADRDIIVGEIEACAAGSMGSCCGPGSCGVDMNGDGMATYADLYIFDGYLNDCPIVGGYCMADLNQDGVVDVSDQAESATDMYDVNGDGIFGDDHDDRFVVQFLCPNPCVECPQPPDECIFDLDGDGDVDAVDAQLHAAWRFMGECPD